MDNINKLLICFLNIVCFSLYPFISNAEQTNPEPNTTYIDNKSLDTNELVKSFIRALQNGDSVAAKSMLERNIDVNFIIEWSKNTPLLIAAESYGPNKTPLDEKIIAEIARKSNIEVVSAKNWEALFHAADKGLTDVLIELLDKDIDLTIERSVGYNGKNKRNLVGAFIFGEASSYSRIEPFESHKVLVKMSTKGFDMRIFRDALKKGGYWKVASQLGGATSDEISDMNDRLICREIEYLIRKDDIDKFVNVITENSIQLNDFTNTKYHMLDTANTTNSKKIIIKLLENGIKPDNYQTYKLLANSTRHIDEFVSLFKNYPVCFDVKQQLFKKSILNKQTEILKFLLNEGVDINSAEPLDRYPDFLGGAQPNVLENSMSPLMISAFKHDYKLLSLLLNQKYLKVNVNASLPNKNIFLIVGNDNSGLITKNQIYSALFYACLANDYLEQKAKQECVRLLIEFGAEVNPSELIALPLHAAIMTNNLFLVKELVSHGALLDPNGHSSPLIMALRLKRAEIASYLIEHGANIKALEFVTNLSAADIAAESRQIPFIKLLDFEKKYTRLLVSLIPSKNSHFIGYWLDEPTMFWSKLTYSYVQFLDNGEVHAGSVGENGLEEIAFNSATYWREIDDKTIETVSENSSGSVKGSRDVYTYHPDDDYIVRQTIAEADYLEFMKKNGVKTTEKLKRINKDTKRNHL